MPALRQNASPQQYWTRQTEALRRKVNLAWWLEAMTLPGCIAACATTAVLWWLRMQYGRIEVGLPGCAVAVVCMLVAAWVAWWRAKERFESVSESAVRLEAALGLYNALTAARAGVACWPEIRTFTPNVFCWNFGRLVPPWAIALTLPWMALWLPVPDPAAGIALGQGAPQSWSRLERELDRLEQEQLVAADDTRELRRQLDDLKSQPQEAWFNHASLEAADHLERQVHAESDRLSQAMQQAAQAAAALELESANANRTSRDAQAEGLAEALEKLEQGGMKANPQLMEQFRQLTPEQLADLDAKQLQELRQQLEQQARQLQAGRVGEGQAGEPGGEGGNNGANPAENGGNGGVQRGPGHDPRWAGEARERTASGEAATVPPRNLSHAAPGDLLGLESGQHAEPNTPQTSTHTQESLGAGSGGARIWETPLDPSEQRAVKRFFE